MWIVVAGVFLLSAVIVRFARRVALKKALLDIFAAVPLIAAVESRWAVQSLLRQGFGGQTARGGSTDALLVAAVLVVWPFLADAH